MLDKIETEKDDKTLFFEGVQLNDIPTVRKYLDEFITFSNERDIKVGWLKIDIKVGWLKIDIVDVWRLVL